MLWPSSIDTVTDEPWRARQQEFQKAKADAESLERLVCVADSLDNPSDLEPGVLY